MLWRGLPHAGAIALLDVDVVEAARPRGRVTEVGGSAGPNPPPAPQRQSNRAGVPRVLRAGRVRRHGPQGPVALPRARRRPLPPVDLHGVRLGGVSRFEVAGHRVVAGVSHRLRRDRRTHIRPRPRVDRRCRLRGREPGRTCEPHSVVGLGRGLHREGERALGRGSRRERGVAVRPARRCRLQDDGLPGQGRHPRL